MASWQQHLNFICKYCSILWASISLDQETIGLMHTLGGSSAMVLVLTVLCVAGQADSGVTVYLILGADVS